MFETFANADAKRLYKLVEGDVMLATKQFESGQLDLVRYIDRLLIALCNIVASK